MTDPTVQEAPAFREQTWDLSYRHALGETTGGFLRGLAEGKVLGRRCPECERVLVAPRSFCDRCLVETTDWVEVGHEGTLEMATVVYEPFKGLPDPPYALAYLLLEGADTALVGYVHGLDLDDPERAAEMLRVGTSARLRFVEQPTGSARDYWFELA